MSVSLVNQLGGWPENCVDQQNFFNQLAAGLGNITQQIEDGQAHVVSISQSAEPSQAQWEAQWSVQTGRPLPIPSSAVLLWWDTSNEIFGGYFGTTAGETTVRRREHRAPIGAAVVLTKDIKTDAQAIVTGIAQNNAKMPSVTVTLLQKTTLILEFSMAVSPAVVPTAYGTDFMVNAVKLGTSIHSMPPDYGMVNRDDKALLFNQYIVEDLEPGTYVINVMFGLVGVATGTLNIGGTGFGGFGMRQLIVRGYAVA